ncbi:MAG: hypothetical protein H7Y09_06865, partial [Chitinophagaceae bacterium]|nr:hypothetical protein [Anaerolineae bacterium]
MSADKRRLLSSLISLLVLTSMLLGMISPLSSLNLASAQETTPEPTPEITPEVPTPETTDLPVPTPEATQPPVAPFPTPDVTVTPDVPPVLPIDPTVYQEDFQDGDATGWLLSPGWALASAENNTYLTTTGAFETATVTGLVGENVAISAKFGLEAGNTANIAFRVGVDNYNVTLNAEGRVSLYQGLTLLVEGAAVSEVTAEPIPTINPYLLGIQAVGGLITVTVNGTAQITHTAPSPLAAGMVIFSTGQANTGAVTLDDIRIELLPASVLPPVEPATAVPTPELPLIEVTPEVTIEATAEATLEATPEVTVEPEITPEAPSGPTPILSADFEGELVGWTLSETGASVIDGEENNFLALENGTFAPDSALFLTDFRIDGRANFTSGAFSIVFRSSEGRAYTLVVAADSTSLTREGDATDTESTPEATAEATAESTETPAPTIITLVTVPAARTAEAWYAISLEAVGGTITLSVDGVT